VIEGLPFAILMPAVLGLLAGLVWLVMLFMFKAKAQLEYKEGMITLTVKNARITHIERKEDQVVVHFDREAKEQILRLAA
jgi:hypothetical protein